MWAGVCLINTTPSAQPGPEGLAVNKLAELQHQAVLPSGGVFPYASSPQYA